MPNRENNFAVLHFIGACMVIYGHQYALMGAGGRCPLLLGNPVSTLGVKMIFVITGFLITQSFLREQNLGQFLKRRLIRIYPALICCVVVCTFALSLFSTLNLADYFRWCWQYLLKNLALQPVYALPGVFENNPYPNTVNGSLWTLPVEVAMYFFVGISLWLFTRFRDKVFRIGYTAMVLAVVMAEAVKDTFGITRSAAFYGTDWLAAMDLIPYMLIGSLFEVANLKEYCNIQLATILLFCTTCISYQHIELAAFIVLPYFTMSFALCEKPFFAGLFEKNNIAYGVYLWGFPVQQLLIYLLVVKANKPWSVNVFFVLSLIPVIGLAFLSHRFVEKPIEGFLKSKLLKKKAITI